MAIAAIVHLAMAMDVGRSETFCRLESRFDFTVTPSLEGSKHHCH